MSEQTKITSWKELFEKAVELGLGAALLTKESADKLVDELVHRGEVSREEGKKILSEMLEKGKSQKDKLEEIVTEIVHKAMKRADLTTSEDFKELERRVAALEARLSASDQSD